MARPVGISDEAIIEIAQELFLAKGIATTEMKDIAQRANIGRSSLYRHFDSKEGIAFRIAEKILGEMTFVLEAPLEVQAETGAQEVLWLLERYTQMLIDNPEWVRFLDEFDQFFSDVYPDGKASADYVRFTQQLSNGTLDEALERGERDGSLRIPCSVPFTGKFLLNSLLAMGQRVIPRIDHYKQEHGYSLEYLTLLPQVLVKGISGK